MKRGGMTKAELTAAQPILGAYDGMYRAQEKLGAGHPLSNRFAGTAD